MARRQRKGAGCVYRPKFKTKDGGTGFGSWRIKFVCKNQRTGQPVFCDEKVNAANKTVAQEILNKRRVEFEAGLAKPSKDPGALTYDQLREGLISSYIQQDRKSLLIGRDGKPYISSLNHLDKFFGTYLAVAIDTGRVNAFIAERKEAGASNTSINRSLELLRRMFRIAVKAKTLTVDYMPDISLLPKAHRREVYLDPGDFSKLRQELPEPVRPVCSLGYFTGMRLGEIQRLEWKNVYLDGGPAGKDNFVKLDGDQTKNGEPRLIPLIFELPEMFRILHAKSSPDMKFVFGGDKPLGNFRKTWNAACVRAGLGSFEKLPGGRKKYHGFVFHGLRHTAATNLASAGVPADVAMSMTGHVSTEAFKRYLHMSRPRLNDAAEKLERYLGPTISQRPVKVDIAKGAMNEETKRLIQ